jgi:hypothetical protein
MTQKIYKLSELEMNNLCEYLGYDFTDNSQFENCVINNDYIQVWNNDIQEYEYIYEGEGNNDKDKNVY